MSTEPRELALLTKAEQVLPEARTLSACNRNLPGQMVGTSKVVTQVNQCLEPSPWEEEAMKHIIDGHVVELPTRPDGLVASDDLRRATGMPRDSFLFLQLPDGRLRLVGPGEDVQVQQDQLFFGPPRHHRDPF